MKSIREIIFKQLPGGLVSIGVDTFVPGVVVVASMFDGVVVVASMFDGVVVVASMFDGVVSSCTKNNIWFVKDKRSIRIFYYKLMPDY